MMEPPSCTCAFHLSSDADYTRPYRLEIQTDGSCFKFDDEPASDGVVIKRQMLMSDTVMCSLQAATQKMYAVAFKRQQSVERNKWRGFLYSRSRTLAFFPVSEMNFIVLYLFCVFLLIRLHKAHIYTSVQYMSSTT